MIKKIVESIVIILAILTIGFIAISNLFFTSNIINDVSEQVNINKITTISLTISIFVIGIILSFRSIYTKNKIFKKNKNNSICMYYFNIYYCKFNLVTNY